MVGDDAKDANSTCTMVQKEIYSYRNTLIRVLNEIYECENVQMIYFAAIEENAACVFFEMIGSTVCVKCENAPL